MLGPSAGLGPLRQTPPHAAVWPFAQTISATSEQLQNLQCINVAASSVEEQAELEELVRPQNEPPKPQLILGAPTPTGSRTRLLREAEPELGTRT
eukprot:3480800-Prymnesium_polylepis.2